MVDFSDYDLLCEICDKMKYKSIEIVCGMARGADMLGYKYAKENGYKIKEFPADWNKYGRGAGHIRNNQMLNYGEALITFWDGKSKGTKNMIDISKKKGILVKVVF